MKFYFDSSALTKRYIREEGSDQIDNFFQETDSVVVNSICFPEIISALTRLRRENKLNGHQYQQCKRAAIEDFASFEVCQLSSEILRTSVTVLENTSVRAADAIHIASAIETKAALFISNDKKQMIAAKQFKLMVNSV